MKVFWCSNFSKMLPRCGRVAHICEANSILQSVFPAAIAFFETCQFAIRWFLWNKLQIRTRQRGNCSTLAGKSRGGTPFCRTLKIGIPKNVFRWDVSLQLFPRNSCKGLFTTKVSQGGAVLFAPPRKAVAFLTTPSVCQKHGTGISLPAGSDQGYSPWTSPAFLKNCWIKKLFICLRFIIDKPLFLEKPPESGSARLGHIPSLPWESQLPLKPYLLLQPLNFKGNCDSLRFSPRFLL